MQERFSLVTYSLVVVLAVVSAGCSSSSRRGDALPGPDDIAGMPEPVAWYANGRLVLEYGPGATPVYLAAHWTADDLRKDRHNYRAAHLEAWAPDPDDAPTLIKGATPATLMTTEDWAAVTHELFVDMLPADAEGAVAFWAEGRPMLAYRDSDDRLQIARREESVASAMPVTVLDDDRLAALAETVISALFPQQSDVPLLFPTGEEGDAYVLFDLSRRLSVFLVRPDSLDGEPLGQSLTFGLRLADAVVLRGHLMTPITRPVSTISSLLSYTWHTVLTFLQGDTGTAQAAPPPVDSAEGMDLEAFEARLDDLSLPPRQRGRVRFLIDGPAFFDAFTRAMDDARESIKVRVYIFGTDGYALRIADRLKTRSESVNVQVLVDYLGSLTSGWIHHGGAVARKPPASIVDYLATDSKVRVRPSTNVWFIGDHTKAIVLDGRRAFVGGMNIDRRNRYQWHDMMAEVEGPIVNRLEADFDTQWAASGPGGDLARFLTMTAPRPHPEYPATEDDVDLRPIYTAPGNAQMLLALREAIRSARQYIYIENPYVTDDQVIAELVRARQRGVDVRLILPSRLDLPLMTSANLVAASDLLSNGVRVYVYPGMTHLKAALIDGWALFGSANLDKLSLRVNLETNLASSDPAVADALLTRLFEPDFARSEELDRPPALGFGTYFANFFADHL